MFLTANMDDSNRKQENMEKNQMEILYLNSWIWTEENNGCINGRMIVKELGTLKNYHKYFWV